jgi:hypothetical protein
MDGMRPIYISWCIDSALAIAIVLAVWQGGQLMQRFEVVAAGFESLSARVAQLEHHPLPNNTAERVSVMESKMAGQEQAIRELKADLFKRLDRIEGKVDGLR